MESTINNARNTLNFEVLQENVETIDNLRLTKYRSKCQIKPEITSLENSEDLKQIVGSLNQVLDNIIRSRTELACARDYISVQLDTSENKTIFVPYQRIPISPNILDQLNKYSKSTYSLDDPFEITIRIITAPENIEAGRKAPSCESADTFYNRKKCLIVMNNKDNLCGFYAMSLGHWLIKNPDYLVNGSSAKMQWRSFRRSLTRGGLNTIKQLAKTFCRSAGLALEKIRISMLPSIQERFKDEFQIVVFERPRIKRAKINMLFVGLSSATPKVLLEYVNNKEGGHMNLITSITGYLDAAHYCWGCYSPMRRSHSCTGETKTMLKRPHGIISQTNLKGFKLLVFLRTCVHGRELSCLIKCDSCLNMANSTCATYCNKSMEFYGKQSARKLNDFICNILSPYALKHGGNVIVIGCDNNYTEILEDIARRDLVRKQLLLDNGQLVKLSLGNVIFRDLSNFHQQRRIDDVEDIMREYINMFEIFRMTTGSDFFIHSGTLDEFALQVLKSTMLETRFSNKCDYFFKSDEDNLEERLHRSYRRSRTTKNARIQDTCFSSRRGIVEQSTLNKINMKFTTVKQYSNGFMFPTGIPRIISPKTVSVEQDISTFFGFIRCTVIAPISNTQGLLPVSRFGKFVYPKYHKDITDTERTFNGTWATPELLFALEHGYEIKHIFEIIHYDQRSDIYEEYRNKWNCVKNNITDRLLTLPWWHGTNTSQFQGLIAQRYSDQLIVLKPEYEITSQTEISSDTVSITYKYRSRQPLGPLHPDAATAAFAAAYKRLHLNKEISALTKGDAVIVRVEEDKIWYTTEQTPDFHLNEKYIASGNEAMALLRTTPDEQTECSISVGMLMFKATITQIETPRDSEPDTNTI